MENDEEYLRFLLKKVVEEARELEYSIKEGNTKEELADVLELVKAIMELKGYGKEEIERLREEKAGKNGSFKKRILMLKNE